MKYLIILLVNIIAILFLVGCKEQIPTEKDIIGTWISKDSIKIHFYEDHSFEIIDEERIVLSHFFPSTEEMIINEKEIILDKAQFKGQGDWFLEEYMSYGYLVIKLSFRFENLPDNKVGGFLDLSGRGIFGNKPPWYLFYYIGDPDENNRYIFHKKTT